MKCIHNRIMDYYSSGAEDLDVEDGGTHLPSTELKIYNI